MIDLALNIPYVSQEVVSLARSMLLSRDLRSRNAAIALFFDDQNQQRKIGEFWWCFILGNSQIFIQRTDSKQYMFHISSNVTSTTYLLKIYAIPSGRANEFKQLKTLKLVSKTKLVCHQAKCAL